MTPHPSTSVLSAPSVASSPPFGCALLQSAHGLRNRLAARRDLLTTRAIHKRLGLPRPEPVSGRRYGHVLFLNEIITPVNHPPIYMAAEFGETNGCRVFRLDPGSGPFDLYSWRSLYSLSPSVPSVALREDPPRDLQEALRRWWRAHEGEPYGYLPYVRLWLRGLLGSGDWTKVRLTAGGLVCSTAWAKAWFDHGRVLYAAQHLHWSIITPHMLAAAPELTLIRKDWRP